MPAQSRTGRTVSMYSMVSAMLLLSLSGSAAPGQRQESSAGRLCVPEYRRYRAIADGDCAVCADAAWHGAAGADHDAGDQRPLSCRQDLWISCWSSHADGLHRKVSTDAKDTLRTSTMTLRSRRRTTMRPISKAGASARNLRRVRRRPITASVYRRALTLIWS